MIRELFLRTGPIAVTYQYIRVIVFGNLYDILSQWNNRGLVDGSWDMPDLTFHMISMGSQYFLSILLWAFVTGCPPTGSSEHWGVNLNIGDCTVIRHTCKLIGMEEYHVAHLRLVLGM
jgi:hypothetical protein